MTESIEVPPFNVDLSEKDVTFRFMPASLEHGFEYPPNLEGMIAGAIEKRPQMLANRQIVIDLDGLPAISSKQLGAMLAVRTACGLDRKIRVVNLRPNVRELLHVTKLGDFFDWDE
jgi:hypothetical protein